MHRHQPGSPLAVRDRLRAGEARGARQLKGLFAFAMKIDLPHLHHS
jgi:hypothetical protein